MQSQYVLRDSSQYRKSIVQGNANYSKALALKPAAIAFLDHGRQPEVIVTFQLTSDDIGLM